MKKQTKTLLTVAVLAVGGYLLWQNMKKKEAPKASASGSKKMVGMAGNNLQVKDSKFSYR
jgi:predicted negative regulator of RcsB-dependent stress response